MTLTEKTLELNITHELLTNADALWHALNFAASTPRLVAHCHCFRPTRLPARLTPPFAIGLTLRDEDRKGWDVKLDIPVGGQGLRHVLFIQFKSAGFRHFSSNKQSAFHGSASRKNVHCLFGINNNTKRDQHTALSALAGNPAYRDSVIYALPRLPSKSAFFAWVGRLAHITSFLRVGEIDRMASAARIRIMAGTSHHVGISFDGSRQELRSDPISLNELPDNGGVLAADLFELRLHATLREWGEVFRTSWNRSDSEQVNWAALFDTYLVGIGRYFGMEARTLAERVPGFRPFPEDELVLADARNYLSELAGQTFPDSDDGDAANSRALLLNAISDRGLQVVQRVQRFRELFANPTRPWFYSELAQPELRSVVDASEGSVRFDGTGEPSFRTVESVSYTVL